MRMTSIRRSQELVGGSRFWSIKSLSDWNIGLATSWMWHPVWCFKIQNFRGQVTNITVRMKVQQKRWGISFRILGWHLSVCLSFLYLPCCVGPLYDNVCMFPRFQCVACLATLTSLHTKVLSSLSTLSSLLECRLLVLNTHCSLAQWPQTHERMLIPGAHSVFSLSTVSLCCWTFAFRAFWFQKRNEHLSMKTKRQNLWKQRWRFWAHTLPVPPSSFTHVHSIQSHTLPTPTFFTIMWTQVLCCLARLTRSRVSGVTMRPDTSLTILSTHTTQCMWGV